MKFFTIQFRTRKFDSRANVKFSRSKSVQKNQMSDEFWTMFNTPKKQQNTLQVSALVQDCDHFTTDHSSVMDDLGQETTKHVEHEVKELGKREKEIIYRGKMGALFKELNYLISSNRKCSNSRLSVLEKSIDYIQNLKSEHSIVREENIQLKEENARLRQLIQAQYSTSMTSILPSPPSTLL